MRCGRGLQRPSNVASLGPGVARLLRTRLESAYTWPARSSMGSLALGRVGLMPMRDREEEYQSLWTTFLDPLRSPAALAALVLLLATGTLMAISVHDDSDTADEGHYLTTGYLYWTQHSSRIGFEHPPLVKTIAAFPLLFLKLRPASDFIDLDRIQLASSAPAAFIDRFVHSQPLPAHELLFWSRLAMI